MDAAGVPKLAQDSLQVLRDMVVGVLTILEQRGLRGPVTQVAELLFEAGGMRKTLQRIADGQGTEQDLRSLQHQLVATQLDVDLIVDRLKLGYNKLMSVPEGLKVAHEIGDLIDGPLCAKTGIRNEIYELAATRDPKNPNTIELAKQSCRDIDYFNQQLIELHQRVLKPAAEIFQPRRA
jgi:hypothetical protein